MNHYRTHRPTTMKKRGKVISMMDKFGFIKAAFPYPNGDVFFHYSNVLDDDDNLEVGCEVEFVLRTFSGKEAAYEVRKLGEDEKIVWEIPIRCDPADGEEVPERKGDVENESKDGEQSKKLPAQRWRGYVTRALPSSNHRSSFFDSHKSESSQQTEPGLVRVLSANANDPKVSIPEEKQQIVRFFDSRGRYKLRKDDLVEFEIVYEVITEQLLAKNISLIETSRDRLLIEKEKNLLETAKPERGIVVELNKESGYIKSLARREKVHFIYSRVKLENDVENIIIEIGQEVEFHVINDDSIDIKGKQGRGRFKIANTSLSARQIKILPKGSVQFFHSVAESVEGMIKVLPRVPTQHNAGYPGVIKLKQPLEREGEIFEEVNVSFEDIMGGIRQSYGSRGDKDSELWIKKGDVLCFDVVYDVVEGGMKASDIFCQNDEEKGVKLVTPCYIGRSEGIVCALKKMSDGFGFGFIRCAEEKADNIYFNMNDLLPETLLKTIPSSPDARSEIATNSAVSFDILTRKHEGKEKRFADRIVLLPKSSVIMEKTLVTGMKGMINLENKKRSTWNVIMDECVELLPNDVMRPYIAQALDSIGSYSDEISFPERQQHRENNIIMGMAHSRGLEANLVGVDLEHNKKGHVVVRKASKADSSAAEGNIEDKSAEALEKENIVNDRKQVKEIVIEKQSFVSRGSSTEYPKEGDFIQFDVIQKRCDGKVEAANITILDRKAPDEEAETKSTSETVGIVDNIMKYKSYGFIAMYNEANNFEKEKIFFHFNDVTLENNNQRGKGRGRNKQSDNFLRKGDEVSFVITFRNGKKSASGIHRAPMGSVKVPEPFDSNPCQGYILIEPSHTSLSVQSGPSKHLFNSKSSPPEHAVADRFKNIDVGKSTSLDHPAENGLILLTFDPGMIYTRKEKLLKTNDKEHIATTETNISDTDNQQDIHTTEAREINIDKIQTSNVVDSKSCDDDDVNGYGQGGNNISMDAETSNERDSGDKRSITLTLPAMGEDRNCTDSVTSHNVYSPRELYISYKESGIASKTNSDTPRRGDLVSFSKGKGGLANKIRLKKKSDAELVRGTLKAVDIEKKSSLFQMSDDKRVLDANLKEVVGCHCAALKESDLMEGILYNNKLYGLARVRDLVLDTKVLKKGSERPRLNVSLKHDTNKKYIQAEGPDGTVGFRSGWTKRKSLYVFDDVEIVVDEVITNFPDAMTDTLNECVDE